MTLRRLVVCVVAVAAISIVNVYHRALSVKYGYEIGRAEKRSAELAASIAALEGRVTMLASPSRLRGQNDRMQLGLVSPSKWQEAPSSSALAQLGGSERGMIER